MSMRSGRSQMNIMDGRYKSKIAHVAPQQLYKRESVPDINAGGLSMMISKSAAKIDTMSNISRRDGQRIAQFN